MIWVVVFVVAVVLVMVVVEVVVLVVVFSTQTLWGLLERIMTGMGTTDMFGALLGFEATSMLCLPLGGCGVLGVSVERPCLFSCVLGTRAPCVGVWCGGVGLLFGNCIVNASILK